jgi:hypothetical protein
MHPANRYNLRSAGEAASAPTTPEVAPIKPPRRRNSVVTLSTLSRISTLASTDNPSVTPVPVAPMAASSYLSNIKLEPFQGNGFVEIDTWLEKFERLGGRENVSEEQKYLDLQYCLQGNAGLWYSSVAAKDPSIKDYKSLKSALSSRFSTIDKDDIPSIKQLVNEKVEEYYYNFLRAVKHCDLSEGQKVRLFIKGLSSETQTYVRLQDVKTLEEARKKAVAHEEATFHQTPNVASVTTPPVDHQRLVEEVSTKVFEKLATQMEHMYRSKDRQLSNNTYRHRSQGPIRGRGRGYQNHSREQQHTTQQTYIPTQPQQQQQQPQQQQPPQQQQQPQQQHQPYKCPTCEGMARNCSYFYNQYCPGKTLTCLRCGKYGHMSYVCH